MRFLMRPIKNRMRIKSGNPMYNILSGQEVQSIGVSLLGMPSGTWAAMGDRSNIRFAKASQYFFSNRGGLSFINRLFFNDNGLTVNMFYINGL